MDDIDLYSHNRWCGALAALDDLNGSHPRRNDLTRKATVLKTENPYL